MVFISPPPSRSSSYAAAAVVRISYSPPPPPPTRPPAPPNLKGGRRMVPRGSMSGGRSIGRRLLLAASTSPLLRLVDPNTTDGVPASSRSARAAEARNDESQQEEERVVRIFEVTSPSVVFIKDVQLLRDPKKSGPPPGTASVAGGGEEDDDWISSDDDGIAKVEGTGSGFVWDKAGHIVFLQDSNGNTFAKEGKLIGFDPAYDLAVLKVNVGDILRPALIGTSHDLRVGQSCFAIGNPYGYEHTLTTGVVSGLGREIPSPNGRPIRGAIQTDAAINAGNSGGPLIDSYGHVIGVNTATFTRRGTGISSGVNFAIPIDVVVRTVPYLIVYGTSVSNRPVLTVLLFLHVVPCLL